MVPALGHLRPGPMIPSADLVRVQVQEQQAVQVGVGVSGEEAAAAVELNRKSKAEDSETWKRDNSPLGNLVER